MTSGVDRFRYVERDGRCVTFIDTPGFNLCREGITDTDIMRTIASFPDAECVVWFFDAMTAVPNVTYLDLKVIRNSAVSSTCTGLLIPEWEVSQIAT